MIIKLVRTATDLECKLIFVPVLVFSFIAITGCGSRQQGDDVAASVDGRKIYTADVEKYYQNQTAGSSQQPVGEQSTSLRLSILRELIDNEILMRRAEKLGLLATDEEVEARILESIEHAEDDFKARQLAEARVEADAILAATEKAKQSDAYMELSEEDRKEINKAVNQLLMAYHHHDHLLIRVQIDLLNRATETLAENMMNTAVRGALKGTKI